MHYHGLVGNVPEGRRVKHFYLSGPSNNGAPTFSEDMVHSFLLLSQVWVFSVCVGPPNSPESSSVLLLWKAAETLAQAKEPVHHC